MRPRPPVSPLFPYTPLFRSDGPRNGSLAACVSCVRSRAAPVTRAFFSLSLRSEEHTSELQSHHEFVCRLLLEKKELETRAGTALGARFVAALAVATVASAAW